MSRLRSFPRALAVLSASLLALGAAACDEDGKTTPARCADPPLPLYDIQHAGAPADDNARYNDADELPCVTEVGHAISKPVEVAGGSSGGNASGGSTGLGGKASGGSPDDAGAGGA